MMPICCLQMMNEYDEELWQRVHAARDAAGYSFHYDETGDGLMPDLTLDEADRCPHCGKILRMPPICCLKMANEYDEEMRRRVRDASQTAGYSFYYDEPNYLTDDPFYPNEFDGDSD